MPTLVARSLSERNGTEGDKICDATRVDVGLSESGATACVASPANETRKQMMNVPSDAFCDCILMSTFAPAGDAFFLARGYRKRALSKQRTFVCWSNGSFYGTSTSTYVPHAVRCLTCASTAGAEHACPSDKDTSPADTHTHHHRTIEDEHARSFQGGQSRASTRSSDM